MVERWLSHMADRKVSHIVSDLIEETHSQTALRKDVGAEL